MRSLRLGRSRRICALSILALVATACGGDDSADDAPASTGTATPAATSAPSTDSGPSTGSAPGTEPETMSTTGSTSTSPTDDVAPVQGGELVVGGIFDAFGLEPATFVGAVTDGHMSGALYDSLMTYTPDGGVEPWLAQSLETSDDQVWTVRLRAGVTFHDGTTFDAEAVKLNLERHKDPALKSRAANPAGAIAEVTVIDPLTAQITLAFPWAAFDEMLAGNLGLMASPAAIAAGTLNQQPVGTGPFTFVEHRPGDRLVVERNDGYWREGEPHLDRITYRVILDDAVRRSSVDNGELHAAQVIRPEVLDEAAEDGLGVTRTPGHANTIHMNTQTDPTADVRVRQALAMAIDYDAINDVIYDGTAEGDHHFLSSESPFHDPDVVFPTYDPDAARALIEEYEAEHGPVSFTFRCYNGETPVQMTQLVTQMWSAVGVDVELQLTDQISLVIDMLQGNFTVGCLALGAETYDPDSIFYNQFFSTSSTNYGKYRNAEMDAALELGRTSTDEATRREAYSTVQELLARDMPAIEWARPAWGWIMDESVHGLVALPGAEFRPGSVFVVDR